MVRRIGGCIARHCSEISSPHLRNLKNLHLHNYCPNSPRKLVLLSQQHLRLMALWVRVTDWGSRCLLKKQQIAAAHRSHVTMSAVTVLLILCLGLGRVQPGDICRLIWFHLYTVQYESFSWGSLNTSMQATRAIAILYIHSNVN